MVSVRQWRVMVACALATMAVTCARTRMPHTGWAPSDDLRSRAAQRLDEFVSLLPDLDPASLSLLVSDLDALASALPYKKTSRGLSETSDSDSHIVATTPLAACCCKPGRCYKDEGGLHGYRAQERDNGSCCKFMAAEASSCSRPWIKKPNDDCENSMRRDLEQVIQSARPAQGETKAACERQLQNAYGIIEKMITAHSFHGSWVYSAHRSHLTETIQHKLFVAGEPLHGNEPGSHIFSILALAKMLWSGVDSKRRARWKEKLSAGELSRGSDCKFAQIVEDPLVGQLRACQFERNVAGVWEVASASFATVDPAKTIYILIGKVLSALVKTAFWLAEVPGLARYPPSGAIVVITMNDDLPCWMLMEALTERIETIVRGSRVATRRWMDRSDSFTCKQSAPEPSEGASALGARFPQPMWTAVQLKEAGYKANELKREDLSLCCSAKQLKEAGYKLAQVKDAGFAVEELKDAGFTPKEFKDAGCSEDYLFDAGFNLQQIEGAGYPQYRNAFDVMQIAPHATPDVPVSYPIARPWEPERDAAI